MNKHLNSLTDYPFQYLSELLQGVESESNDLIGLHIGEPKGNPPEEALDIIKNGAKSYSKYPTSNGEDSLRESYCNWLVKRFSIKDVDPKKNVLPVSGTREGIFSFIQSVIDT